MLRFYFFAGGFAIRFCGITRKVKGSELKKIGIRNICINMHLPVILVPVSTEILVRKMCAQACTFLEFYGYGN